jgi:(4-(4-[2-(gamma-L-glutamylamino)ethyl]phenoxymethyl)furan-2-yl)methanamine synthase
VTVVGWDVGGVNTKVARVDEGALRVVRGRPFELQRAPEALVALLRELASEVGAPGDPAAVTHAVTMTAELSQMFRTKREGVAFVLDAMRMAFPSSAIRVFSVDGRFVDEDRARAHPLTVAAANWTATATLVARHHRDALLVDIGTTTTDLIPIVDGLVVADGRTDPDRLATGELVYTGALRTPVEAIVSHVAIGGRSIGVSAEGFALAGDVHVWRGDLASAEYTVPTPDGRPATREFAGERLARVICADREMLDERGISAIADAVADAQAERIAIAMRRIKARHPSLTTAVVTGLGGFIADRAARSAGFAVERLSSALGGDGARCAPAASVALLLDATPRVEMVIKIGGSLLARIDDFERVLTSIAGTALEHRVLIVPGGGPFADAVRDVDERVRLTEESAHWMAILAMDQYAHVIVQRLPGAALVTTEQEIDSAIAGGRIPVLAPSRWLRAADPLPHSWDVTSDSIAAWIAGAVGASRLMLIKPSGATGELVDPYFARALPAGVASACVPADHIDVLSGAVHDIRK